MGAGRPTKYSPEIIDKVYEYFGVEAYTKKVKQVPTSSGRVAEIEYERACDIPSIAGFAAENWVGKSTIYDWAKKHPEFSDALDWARVQQEKLLLILGMHGDWSHGLVKMMLINRHEYRDKVEQSISSTQPIVINYSKDE